MKLYLAGSDLKFSQAVDVDDIDDANLLSPQALWKKLGRTGKAMGSVFPSPSNNHLFDGEGWTNPPSTGELAQCLVSKHQYFDVAYTVGANRVTEVIPAVAARLQLNAPNLSSKYSADEQATFAAQYSEAQDITAGGTGDHPFIEAIAAQEDRTPEDLAVAIIRNHDALQQKQVTFVAAANIRRRTLANLNDISDPKQRLESLLTLA